MTLDKRVNGSGTPDEILRPKDAMVYSQTGKNDLYRARTRGLIAATPVDGINCYKRSVLDDWIARGCPTVGEPPIPETSVEVVGSVAASAPPETETTGTDEPEPEEQEALPAQTQTQIATTRPDGSFVFEPARCHYCKEHFDSTSDMAIDRFVELKDGHMV